MNTVPQTTSRYIINFRRAALEEAARAPLCLAIVERRVKPGRMLKTGSEKKYWWLFRRSGEATVQASKHLSRVLVGPVVAKYLAFAFADRGTVFTNALNVFAFDSTSDFAVLQSRVHELWALQFASTLRTDTRYNASDCFETFPLPKERLGKVALEASGLAYHDFRAALMIRNNEGLTETYNRFHNPDEQDTEILRLRELHAAMDRAVLDAYRWTDIHPTCEFIPDYEDDEDEPGKASKRKKPWRYRWPDEIRDEVLGRLLALNAERAREEDAAGPEPTKKSQGRKPRAKAATPLLD